MLLLVLEGGARLLQLFHLLQQGGGVQGLQPLLPVLQGLTQLDGLLQAVALPLQGDQVAAHPVGHRAPGLHPPDFLQRYAQLAHQLDLPQDGHLCLAVVPVAVFAVAPGGQQPLLLIEADVLFGDAHLGLHLVDLHGRSPFLELPYTFHKGEGQEVFEKFFRLHPL